MRTSSVAGVDCRRSRPMDSIMIVAKAKSRMRSVDFFITLLNNQLETISVEILVATDNPVVHGGAVLKIGFLKDAYAGSVGGGNVGIDLVQRGVVVAESGKGADGLAAVTPMAVFVGDDDAHSGTMVDGVVVVELDTSDGFFDVVGKDIKFEFA